LREPTIARNYAEALFQAGERSGQSELFGDLIEAVAGAIAADQSIRVVLESPRVRKEQKQQIVANALGPVAPGAFVRFLSAVIKRGRQGIFGAIAEAYAGLIDTKFNRVHAGVTMAREPDPGLQLVVRQRLSDVVGKDVIPHFRTDPSILGGLIVRMGDRIMDGSLRRKIVTLRKQMLG
jgi:F-type H+-transporting ATPase subunit delta